MNLWINTWIQPTRAKMAALLTLFTP